MNAVVLSSTRIIFTNLCWILNHTARSNSCCALKILILIYCICKRFFCPLLWIHLNLTRSSTTKKTSDSSKVALESKLKPLSKAILQSKQILQRKLVPQSKLKPFSQAILPNKLILQIKPVLQSKLKPILHQSAGVSGPGGPRVAEETPKGSTPATFPSHSPCFSLFLSTLLAVIVGFRKWSFQSSTMFSQTLTFLPLVKHLNAAHKTRPTEKYSPSPLVQLGSI